MEIRTKYDLDDNLYFLHKGKVRYLRPFGIQVTAVESEVEHGQRDTTVVIYYMFDLDKRVVDKAQNEVFKRRADLIKSLQ